jgi:hypothetical protein
VAIVLDDAHLLKRTTSYGVNFTTTIDPSADRANVEAFAQQVRTSERHIFNKFTLGKVAPDGAPTVLLFERDILLKGVGQAHHCPLALKANSLEITFINRMPEAPKQEIDSRDHPRDEGVDGLMKTIMRQFWEKLAVDVNRIGKVYEYIYGPFQEDSTLDWALERFLRKPSGAELLAASGTFLFREGGYTINLNVSPGRSAIGDVIQVRLDIANLDQTQRLENGELADFLTFATRFHHERFKLLLGESK